jgi:hypothetical protein
VLVTKSCVVFVSESFTDGIAYGWLIVLGKDEGMTHCSHVNKYGMTTWLHCSSVLSFLIAKTKIPIKKNCALLAMQLKTNVKMSEHFKKIKPNQIILFKFNHATHQFYKVQHSSTQYANSNWSWIHEMYIFILNLRYLTQKRV